MPVITNIDDLRRLHRRRAPGMFYDYCESGSWTEQTFRDNVSDFARRRLRSPRGSGMNSEFQRTPAAVRLPGQRGRPRTRPKRLAGDKAYSYRPVFAHLRRRRIQPG